MVKRYFEKILVLIMSGQKFTSRPKQMAKKTETALEHFSLREKFQKATHVCAICEEGGDLMFCDGPCMHHFHSDRVSRGAAKYSCQGFAGLNLRNGKWKCPDCCARRAKCSECFEVGSYEGEDGEEPVLRQCPDLLCIRFFCFTCLPSERKACNLYVCDTCDEPEVPSITWFTVYDALKLGIMII